MRWQSVECDSKEHADTKQSSKKMSSEAADMRRVYLRQNIVDKYGRTAGCPGCVGIGQHTGECRARIEQEMVDKSDAIKLETSGNQEEFVPEPDVSWWKRKVGEPDINPGGASSLTADTPKKGESKQGSSAGNDNLLAGCIAAVNKLLCDTLSVDLSRDRTALSGKFPEDELNADRELELRNMLNFDVFELMDELPPQKHAYDMVWVDEWRGDRVRSRLCVRQFKAEGSEKICLRGRQTRFHQLFFGQSCELQGFWITRCRH